MKNDDVFPKLCLDCRYSKRDERSPWTHKCFNVKVVSRDSWALSSNCEGEPSGSSCQQERGRTSYFAPCGMRGKLWEKKVVNP